MNNEIESEIIEIDKMKNEIGDIYNLFISKFMNYEFSFNKEEYDKISLAFHTIKQILSRKQDELSTADEKEEEAAAERKEEEEQQQQH